MISVAVAAVLLSAAGCAGFILARLRRAARFELLEAAVRQDPAPAAARTDLPPEILALARRQGAGSGPATAFVAIEQTGQMWRTPTGKAMSFAARQLSAVASCQFVWRAAMGPGHLVRVLDGLVSGSGRLEVDLLGAVPLVRMVGDPGLNQGEMLRYLAELPWNPDAILMNRSLDWSVVDAATFKVAAGEGAQRGEITFKLNASGLVETASAPSRLFADKGNSRPLPWRGRFWGYERMGGLSLPRNGEVAWVMEGQDFVYWRGALTSWSPSAPAV